MRPGLVQVLICVLIIAVLFGAKKIPELARSIGKAKGEFKKGLEEGERELAADAEAAKAKDAEPAKELV